MREEGKCIRVNAFSFGVKQSRYVCKQNEQALFPVPLLAYRYLISVCTLSDDVSRDLSMHQKLNMFWKILVDRYSGKIDTNT